MCAETRNNINLKEILHCIQNNLSFKQNIIFTFFLNWSFVSIIYDDFDNPID